MQHHTIIIGAGPAGLAVGACLRRRGIRCEILEREDRVGASWQHHYDRLRLHTDKDSSSLPHYPVPQHYPRYLTSGQYMGYLEAYARANRLSPHFGVEVRKIRHSHGLWTVETDGGTLRAVSLVVATGYHREPYTPSWPGLDSFRGEVLHSSGYENGGGFDGRRVLVIGFGNSGSEIALDLHEHGARPVACIRGEVGILPREFMGVPVYQLIDPVARLSPWLASFAAGILMRATLNAPRNDGRRRAAERLFRRTRSRVHTPIIDIGTLELIQDGRVELRPSVRRFVADGAIFTDGSKEHFDAVVLATGYRPGLRPLFDDSLRVLESDGIPYVTDASGPVSGLFFCGFRPSPEGMLRAIGRDAKGVARAIEQRIRSRSGPANDYRSPAFHSP